MVWEPGWQGTGSSTLTELLYCTWVQAVIIFHITWRNEWWSENLCWAADAAKCLVILQLSGKNVNISSHPLQTPVGSTGISMAYIHRGHCDTAARRDCLWCCCCREMLLGTSAAPRGSLPLQRILRCSRHGTKNSALILQGFLWEKNRSLQGVEWMLAPLPCSQDQIETECLL